MNRQPLKKRGFKRFLISESVSGSGAWRPRVPKGQKWSPKQAKSDYFSTMFTVFRLHFGVFVTMCPGGPGNSFRTPFAIWAPRAQMTPIAGISPRKASLLTSENFSVLGCFLKTVTSLNSGV